MSVQIPTTVSIGSLTGENVTVPERWTFADATARASATNPNTGSGYIVTQIGRLAFQASDSTYWRLASITPTWTAVGGGSVAYAAVYRNSVTTDLSSAPCGSLLILDSVSTVTLAVSPAIGYWIDVYAVSTSGGPAITVGSNVIIDLGANQIVGAGYQSQRLAFVGSNSWVAMSGGGPIWGSGL